ncbi:MAG: GNAT family N-acetyltransferase [Clostridia bacterium]|nr:GNAT family N-acetyltransferase [Clostridia bacterium]
MINEITLERPNINHKEQAIKFIEEVEKFEPNERVRYSGFSSLQDYKENYENWLKKIEIYTKAETLPEGRVMADVFFSVRKSDNKIVGIINIRHALNDYLYNYGGHIGYCIIPSERRNGYAYKQLLLGLEYCKSININRVLITCLDYNIGSSKTIEKAGGVLENIVENKEANEVFKRYWISLKKRYAITDGDAKKANIMKKTIEVKDELFKGDIVCYEFKNVKNKMIVPDGVCIKDNNYKWLEFYDYSAKTKLTAMYNEKNEVVEWYFDIARKIGKEEGTPYEDDLYLDVVVTMNSEILLLDEDELKAAYKRHEMTKEEYDEAYTIAHNLIRKIKGNEDKLYEFTEKYLKMFLEEK